MNTSCNAVLHINTTSRAAGKLMGNHSLPLPLLYQVKGSETCWTPGQEGLEFRDLQLKSATLWWLYASQVSRRISGQEKFKALKLCIKKMEDHILHPQHLQKRVARSAATSSWETDWWPAVRTKAPEKSHRAQVTTHNYLSAADDSRTPSFGVCNPHLSKLPCTIGIPHSRTPAGTALHKFLLKFFAEKCWFAIQITCLWGSSGSCALHCVCSMHSV